MNVTKNIVTREVALKISPDYVAFVEGDFDKFTQIFDRFEKVKRGQQALTAIREKTGFVFVTGKITSINHNDYRAVDGPVVRFSNGEYSWRVDGDKYAFTY